MRERSLGKGASWRTWVERVRRTAFSASCYVCSLTTYGFGGVGGAGTDSFLAQFVAVTQSPTSWAGAGTLRILTGAPPCGSSVQMRMAWAVL